jgi:hypothetical protein
MPRSRKQREQMTTTTRPDVKEIIEYCIVYGGTQTIVDEVNRLIREGWQPLGGVSRDERCLSNWGQAMVRYRNSNPDRPR